MIGIDYSRAAVPVGNGTGAATQKHTPCARRARRLVERAEAARNRPGSARGTRVLSLPPSSAVDLCNHRRHRTRQQERPATGSRRGDPRHAQRFRPPDAPLVRPRHRGRHAAGGLISNWLRSSQVPSSSIHLRGAWVSVCRTCRRRKPGAPTPESSKDVVDAGAWVPIAREGRFNIIRSLAIVPSARRPVLQRLRHLLLQGPPNALRPDPSPGRTRRFTRVSHERVFLLNHGTYRVAPGERQGHRAGSGPERGHGFDLATALAYRMRGSW